MPDIAFVTVDVFTERRFGGNPLAVFPDARGLDTATMQALAAEFNYSETTFVLPPADARNTAQVRIFTPRTELPFAGHPNVGTGFVLAEHGRDRDGVMRFEEAAGIVTLHVARAAGGDVTVTIAAPSPLVVGAAIPVEDVAACAGLNVGDVMTAAHHPVIASMGLPFVIAEVSAEALARAHPDAGAFRAGIAPHESRPGEIGLLLYVRDGARLRARMFDPLAGIIEDPATGSANVALGGLLLSLGGAAEAAFNVVQGVEMGRPSLLHVAARRTPDGIRATVGGRCVPVLRGTATV
jgi:trans-2,3-dihydro-3-hydroxyanthranilate isomerase